MNAVFFGALWLYGQPDKVNVPPFTINDGLILFWRTVRDFLKSSIERLPYLIVGLVVFLLFWLLGKGVRKLINKVAVQTHSVDDMLANLISRIASTLITIIGFLAACVVIFPSFKPGDIIAGLGITSVAIGFAFKDILQNFFAGLLLLWRRPFKVGDQIRVKDFEGTVEEINMRSTRLKPTMANGQSSPMATSTPVQYSSGRLTTSAGQNSSSALAIPTPLKKLDRLFTTSWPVSMGY